MKKTTVLFQYFVITLLLVIAITTTAQTTTFTPFSPKDCFGCTSVKDQWIQWVIDNPLTQEQWSLYGITDPYSDVKPGWSVPLALTEDYYTYTEPATNGDSPWSLIGLYYDKMHPQQIVEHNSGVAAEMIAMPSLTLTEFLLILCLMLLVFILSFLVWFYKKRKEDENFVSMPQGKETVVDIPQLKVLLQDHKAMNELRRLKEIEELSETRGKAIESGTDPLLLEPGARQLTEEEAARLAETIYDHLPAPAKAYLVQVSFNSPIVIHFTDGYSKPAVPSNFIECFVIKFSNGVLVPILKNGNRITDEALKKIPQFEILDTVTDWKNQHAKDVETRIALDLPVGEIE